MIQRGLRFAAFAGLCVASVSAALAQGYPNKPIRVLIGYAPGGSADAGVRPLARALEPLERIKTDYAKWGAVVKETNIRPE